MSNGILVLENPGRLSTAHPEVAGLMLLVKGLSWRAVREWAGIFLWAVFCLACGSAGVLAALVH